MGIRENIEKGLLVNGVNPREKVLPKVGKYPTKMAEPGDDPFVSVPDRAKKVNSGIKGRLPGALGMLDVAQTARAMKEFGKKPWPQALGIDAGEDQ